MSGGELLGLLEFLAALAWLMIGLISLRIAAQERRTGATTWRWVLPGVGGILLTLWGLLTLWWATT